MFTGLVEDQGKVVGLSRESTGLRLHVQPSAIPLTALTLGQSMAINGCCLTQVSCTGMAWEFQASSETLDRTALGALHVGDWVHLERALALGDRLGGHWVTGHIDVTAALASQRDLGLATELEFHFPAPERFMPLLVEKGSIAVDGVSLTINSVGTQGFAVAIIPHTAEKTHLARLRSGQKVNIEIDVLAKHLARLAGPLLQARGLNMEFLKTHGFGEGSDGQSH